MLLFAIQFLLTNVLFSWLLGLAFLRLDRERNYPAAEILLYALGFGPMAAALILYYLLLFAPHRPALFYIAAVGAAFILIGLVGKGQWSRVRGEIVKAWKGRRAGAFGTVGVVLAAVLLAAYLFFFLGSVLPRPLTDSDAVTYGTLGKVIAQERSLEYRWVRLHPATGFYQTTVHAPSFSLLLTWEKLTGGVFHADQDLYYKSIGSFYAILILAVSAYWLAKRSAILAVLGVLALASAPPLFAALFQTHLDSLRIFFLGVSWIALSRAVTRRDALSVALLGVASGFAAFAHSIGGVVAIFNVGVFLLLAGGTLRYRLRKSCFLLFLIASCGWFHYLLDTIWGDGWLILIRPFSFWG